MADSTQPERSDRELIEPATEMFTSAELADDGERAVPLVPEAEPEEDPAKPDAPGVR